MATNDFDTGSIFGNLLNDIKHIPERTMQQSRSLRADTRMDAIRQQAQQDAIQKHLDNAAIEKWQSYHGDAPVPMSPDGKVNRAIINGTTTDDVARHNLEDQVKGVYATGKAARNISLSNKAATDLGVDIDPESIGQPATTAAQKPMVPTDTPDDAGYAPSPKPAAPSGGLPSSIAAIAQRLMAAETAKKMQDYGAQKDIASSTALAQTKAGNDQKRIDDYGKIFGIAPAPDEIANGALTPAAANKLYNGSQKVAEGYRRTDTGDWEPIPGSKPWDAQKAAADKKIAADEAAKAKAAQGLQAQTDLQSNIQQAQGNLGGESTLFGLGTRSGVLGSHLTGINQGAADLGNSLNAVTSGQGIGWLNDMKNAANGSTGIGRIMKTEFDAAGAAQRNLHQNSSHDQLQKNLADLSRRASRMQRLYQEHMNGVTDVPQWYKDELSQESGASVQPQRLNAAPAQPATTQGGFKILSVKKLN